MTDRLGEKVSRWKILKLILRHPLKGIAIACIGTIAMAVTSEVDWSTALFTVQTGQTAQSHQVAEGIE